MPPVVWGVIVGAVIFVILVLIASGCSTKNDYQVDTLMGDSELNDFCEHWKQRSIFEFAKSYPKVLFQASQLSDGNTRLECNLQAYLGDGYSYVSLAIDVDKDGLIIDLSWERIYSTR